MAQVTRLGLYGGPRSPYATFAAAVTVSVTGTAAAGLTEEQIRTGGETIILTVTGSTWVATVGDDNAITQALIDGLDSNGTEGTGWDAIVKAGLTFAAVTRDSDTQVTILLPAFPSYNVDADETITVTVPATALASGASVVASPTITVTAVIEARGGWSKKRRKGPRPPYRIDEERARLYRQFGTELAPEPEIPEVPGTQPLVAEGILDAPRLSEGAVRAAAEVQAKAEAELKTLAFLEAQEAAEQARLAAEQARLAEEEALLLYLMVA